MKSTTRFRIVLVFLVLFLTAFLQTASLSHPTWKITAATSKTLVVPDSFPSIASAIQSATSGDEIFVKKGVYYENPMIDKSISIKGEDSTNTVLVGAGGLDRGARAVIYINASDVTISGLTIQSQNYSTSALTASGIIIGGDACQIYSNNIIGTYYGVFSSTQSNLTITQNNITLTLKDGIRICGGSNNIIAENRIANNAQSGIALDGYADVVRQNIVDNNYRGLGLGASYSLVFGNNFKGNSESGLYIASSENTITANNITQSKWGIYFTSFFAAPNDNTFYLNNIVNNNQAVGVSSAFNKQIWTSEGLGNYWGDTVANDTHLAYDGNVDTKPLTNPYIFTENIHPPMPTLPTSINDTVAQWHFDEVQPNGATPDTVGKNTVVLEPTGNSYTPILTNGKFGNALQFNGTDYAYVTTSPTLEVKGEITIDAWLNVQKYKENVDYNNIFIECARTLDKFPTRVLGFSINGLAPQNSSAPTLGALRGFILDNSGVFNEIVTKDTVISLNQWIHVTFIRSLTTGMHIYVDGQEKDVVVTSGSQNPLDPPARGTEFYIGHDSISTIDELTISTKAITPKNNEQTTPLSQWWLLTGATASIAFIACIIFYFRRKLYK